MQRIPMRTTLIAFASLSLLSACQRQDPAADAANQAAAPASLTVFESMVATMVPQSNLIWELAGNLYDDDGNIDPELLSAEQWQQVHDGAVAIAGSARTLAATDGIRAAPAGVAIQNEGTAGAPGAAQVQAALDADPQSFKSDAQQLASLADEIAAAATAQDGAKLDELSGRLTEGCGACHEKFWYPEQGG